MKKLMNFVFGFRKVYYVAIFGLLFTLACEKAFSFPGGGSFWPCDMIPHPHVPDPNEGKTKMPFEGMSYMEDPKEIEKLIKSI